MDDKLYVSEKPIYKYIFLIGVEPQGFKNGSQCKIIKHKFVFNEDENFKSYVNCKDTGNFIDAIFIKSEDSYIGEGHSNSVYTVKIINSNGKLKELKFNEREYYFLLTDPPQQQPKQHGGKRKYLKQKKHNKKTMKKQLKKQQSNKIF